MRGLWGCVLRGVVGGGLGVGGRYGEWRSGSEKVKDGWRFVDKGGVIREGGMDEEMVDWGKEEGVEGLRGIIVEDVLRGEAERDWDEWSGEELGVLLVS